MMSCFSRSAGVVVGLLMLVSASAANAGVVKLWGVADGSSSYTEHWANSFFQIDMPDSGTNLQRFHDIDDPSTEYGSTSYDGFPNDANFHLGSITYDDASLVNGTGTTAITGLTLGVGADPGDSSYLNYNRWDVATTVDSFSGTVNVVDGLVIGINLTSNVALTTSSWPNASFSGYFNINGASFVGYMSGDLLAGYGQPTEVPSTWSFSGTLATVPEPGVFGLIAMGGLALLRRRRTAV